jgi:Domain of unknown function (DUF4349)
MMRIPRRAGALALALSLLAGCGGAMSGKSEMAAPQSPAGDAPPPPPAPPPAGAPAPELAMKGERFGGREESPGPVPAKKAPPQQPGLKPKPGEPQTPPGEQPVQKQQSIIIYSAQLDMAVFEVDASIKKIEELAKNLGGFLAKREDRSITIRVPADRFDDAVRTIEKVGDMLHRNIVAEDVTEEYRDLEIRLKGSKAVQERLTQLLQKAQKVEDSIAIERELDRVTMDIDRIEGRMKFLRDRAAFSTITVTFQPRATENVSKNPFRMPTPWLNQLGLFQL